MYNTFQFFSLLFIAEAVEFYVFIPDINICKKKKRNRKRIQAFEYKKLYNRSKVNISNKTVYIYVKCKITKNQKKKTKGLFSCFC